MHSDDGGNPLLAPGSSLPLPRIGAVAAKFAQNNEAAEVGFEKRHEMGMHIPSVGIALMLIHERQRRPDDDAGRTPVDAVGEPARRNRVRIKSIRTIRS